MRVTDEIVQNEGEGFVRESECKLITFDGTRWDNTLVPSKFHLYGISIEDEVIEIMSKHESED